jgi:hypothetical protein
VRVRRSVRILCLAAAIPLAFAACKQETPKPAAPPPAAAPAPAPKADVPPAPKPFAVTGVELGNAIGSDKRVSIAKTRFAPTDTIYASVATDGASPSIELTARWTYGAEKQLVNEEKITIAPTGPAVSEFHIAKPDGWPAGSYQVEILAGGASVATKTFEVPAQ